MHGLVQRYGIAFVALVALPACPAGDDAETMGSAENGDTTGDTTTATTTSASTLTTDATSATTAMTTTSSMTTTEATSSTTSATSATEDSTGDTAGVPCGDSICSDDEYCEWPANSCGDDPYDVPVCSVIPKDCPPSAGDPVCGCDGIVYVNDCGAGLLGVDVREDNDCAAPEGTFECGFKFCDPLYSYCQISYSDIGGYPNGYSCPALPEPCGGMPSCECLAGEPCADFGCEPTPEGGLVVSCPGG